MASDNEFWEAYKDPRWQRRRLEIMSRSRFHCERCDTEDKTLHVHHKKYFKGRKPWEYDDSELICLCSTCHESCHDLNTFIALSTADLLDWSHSRIVGYVIGMRLPSFSDCFPIKNEEQARGVFDFWDVECSDEKIAIIMKMGAFYDLLFAMNQHGESFNEAAFLEEQRIKQERIRQHGGRRHES